MTGDVVFRDARRTVAVDAWYVVQEPLAQSLPRYHAVIVPFR